MVVADVQNHGDTLTMARLHEVLEAVGAAGSLVHCKEVRGAVAPVRFLVELGDGQQFDRIDAGANEVVHKLDGVVERSRICMTETQCADVQLVNDEVFDTGRKGMRRVELVGPELCRLDVSSGTACDL